MRPALFQIETQHDSAHILIRVGFFFVTLSSMYDAYTYMNILHTHTHTRAYTIAFIQVGGSVDGKVMVTLKDPRVSDANDMGNWHNMVPRIKLGMFTFMIGQVPVDIHMYVRNRIRNTEFRWFTVYCTVLRQTCDTFPLLAFLPSCLF